MATPISGSKIFMQPLSSIHKREKDKNKKPEVAREHAEVLTHNPTPAFTSVKKRKFGHEIDEIFKGIEKNKKNTNKENKNSNEKGVEVGEKKRKKKHKGGELFGVGDVVGKDRKKNRRTTNDGLTMYSADELGINNPNAGGTALCPFDCSCCF